MKSDKNFRDIFLKILENPYPFIVLVGIALFIFAAINGYTPLNIKFVSPVWRVLVGVLGIVFIVTGGCATFKKKPGGITDSELKRKVKFRINYVQHAPSSLWLYIEGSFKLKPPGGQVYAFLFDSSVCQYFPKGKVVWKVDKKTWSAVIRLNEFQSESLGVIFAFVGPNSMSLIKQYDQDARTGIRRGIDEFPPDLIVLASKEISLNLPNRPISVS
jgi:hypothetical protein